MNRKIIVVNDLIKNLKNQNPKAQVKLFELYSKFLFNICSRMLDKVEDCQEIVSQVFLKIYRNINKAEFSNEFAFRAWMKRILINEALQLLKKQKFMIRQEDISVHSEISVFNFEDELNYSDLFDLIKSLPTGYRTVFLLHYIEGYTHKEIAEKLGIDVGTSKSQYYKARLLLQNKINRINNSNENTRR